MTKERKPDSRKKRQALDLARGASTYSADPSQLTLVVDPADVFFQKRVNDPVPDGAVLDVAARGVIEPVVVRKRDGESIVIAGRQRTKRVHVVNALVGTPYTGPIVAVREAIKRIEGTELHRTITTLCPHGLKVPVIVRADKTEAEALATTTSSDFWRHDDNDRVRRAEIAQRMALQGFTAAQIAGTMGGKLSAATISRYLKIDLTKPPTAKKARGKATRPPGRRIDEFAEKYSDTFTPREKKILAWIRGESNAAPEL